MKGFINVIKPSGMSSAYAVGAVKKKFNCPCGHMGTLDPMASGVLPVGLHKTSRLFDYLLDKTKRYIATFKFGVLTDTLDSTGNVIATSSVIPSKEQIQSKLTDFVGEISQIPPKYSAKCIDGKRGYELARKGVDFTLAPKIVTILDFKLTKQISDNEFEFTIDCKGGTYIRSLARDLGSSLGSMAIMTSLIRAKSGFFSLENGITIDELKSSSNPEKYIIPADLAVDYEKVVLTDKQATKILNGLFDKYPLKDGFYRVYNQTEFWGIGVVTDGILKIKAYVR